MSIYMDVTPRRLIAMANTGFKSKVLKSFTIRLCASCYSCMANCPKDIKITDIMYAFKCRAIEEKKFPHPKFTITILAQSFYNMGRYGRVTESLLVMQLGLKTGIFGMFNMAPLGMKLMKTDRMKFTPEKVKNRKQIKQIFQALESKS